MSPSEHEAIRPSLSPVPETSVESDSHPQAAEDHGSSTDRDQFLYEWRRFQRVQERRRVHFLSEPQQKTKTTSRLFIISHHEAPWHCFGLTSRIEYCRRVFELSGLHFSELHAACTWGDRQQVEAILQSQEPRGCTMTRDCSGRVPLHHAVVREHHRVVRFLLRQPDNRLQLYARDSRGATPVQCVLEKMQHIAMKRGGEPAKHAKQLRGRNRRYRRLWRLADCMLASMNASFVVEIQALDFETRGDVWDAVRAGDVERLQQIRTLYGDFRDVRLEHLGTTLLHEACCISPRHLNVVLYLLSELHVDRQVADHSSATPLHHAAMRGWLEACVLLMDSEDEALEGIEEELLLVKDARGRTPLHAALHFAGRSRRADDDPRSDITAESVATARYLVQRCPDALHIIDSDGLTALHYAIYTGDQHLVQLMVDLGADAVCDAKLSDPQPASEYREKATWAPCGCVFSRDRSERPSQVPTVQSSVEEATAASKVAGLVDHASAVKATVVGPSQACKRLQQVKAGLVEHPGTALPMETLWFWVHQKPQKTPIDSTVTTPKDVSVPAPSPLEGDLCSYGCRRFGAVCSSCVHGPREATEEVRPLQPSIAVSPLRLAIRCCRRTHPVQANRIAILETLLLAGASPDEAVLEDALRGSTSPTVLQLLLSCSSRRITSEFVLRQFCSGVEPTHIVECRASLLSVALEEIDLEDVLRLLPSLFRYRYFNAVARILARKQSASEEFSGIIRAMLEPTPPRTKSMGQQKLSADHLRWTMQAIDLWPSHSRGLGCLAIACVSEMLNSTVYQTFQTRQTADTAMASALEVILINSRAELDQIAVEWTAIAAQKGFIATLKRLWRVVLAEQERAAELVQRIVWPLRSADASFVNSLCELTPSLAEAVLRGDTQWGERHAGLLSQCLTIACTSCVAQESIRRILTSITHTDCDDHAVAVLLSQRYNGATVIDYIVKRDDVELAELLWTELKTSDAMRERLWVALSRARLRTLNAPMTRSERWQRLLFHTPPTISDNAMRRFVLKTLVRVPQPCEATAASLLRCVSKGGTDIAPEAGDLPFIHAVARWNAVTLARQWVAACESPSETKSQWSRQVTQRDESSGGGYSPIEMCELLGHHELARLLRALVLESFTLASAVATSEHRRHYALLRTVMSLPTSETPPSSTLMPRSHSALDPTKMLVGDWSTAVALDDVRMLQALLLHDFPLQTSSSNIGSEDELSNLQSLLETAIKHGSYDALQWLFLNLSTKIPQLSAETTSCLVHKAASHSSPLYARLTLLLLRQPGVPPGRLCGDGTDVSLLHRVACFSDCTLAMEILELLLQRDGSDVNVRDGFGSTPVMYALASGRLETACWLLSHCATTRLEAEYEGQSLFYYSLHLLPSFAWRCVVQQLLQTKRKAAFLHCKDDDCACKGFECSDGVDEQQSCSFCSHSITSHTRVPYPPWFRDQYETYINQSSSPAESQESNDGNDDDEDEEAAALKRHRALMEMPLADEPTLENDRGRLRLPALLRVTQLRFQTLLTQYDLSIPTVEDAAVIVDEEESAEDLHVHTHAPEPSKTADSGTNLVDADAASSCASSPPQTLQVPHLSAVRKPLLPRFLHGDAAMVSTHEACCAWDLHDATTRRTQTQIVVARWFRAACLFRQDRARQINMFVPSDRAASLRMALARWRGVTAADPSGHTSNHQSPVSPVTQLMNAEREEHTVAERRTTSTAALDTSQDLIGPLGGSPTISTPRVSILQLFVHHWQYARVYQSFRQWKRLSLMVNAQVVHHELETLGDSWSAGDRRVKLQSLVARQQALENEICTLGLVESSEGV